VFTTSSLARLLEAADCCPWGAGSGCTDLHHKPHRSLYTPEERRRRDATPWTLVQGVLAPVQFAVFLISLFLVLRYLATGEGYTAASASIVVKTVTLYTIMITGSIWEREVFGRYLFAPAFFWEDMVSMLVLALHTAYLWALFTGSLGAHELMVLALAAYTTYVINAAQFVLKLRAARREGIDWSGEAPSGLELSK
jgi:3-vinyl bacteriochlorophyllide hydratase